MELIDLTGRRQIQLKYAAQINGQHIGISELGSVYRLGYTSKIGRHYKTRELLEVQHNGQLYYRIAGKYMSFKAILRLSSPAEGIYITLPS